MQVLTGDAACQGSQGHANAQCYVVSRKARTVIEAPVPRYCAGMKIKPSL